jgi:hypothetical protein
MGRRSMPGTRTVIYVRWILTGRVEIFANLGKLYSAYDESQVGISRHTLTKKNIYSGYVNEVVEIFKMPIR